MSGSFVLVDKASEKRASTEDKITPLLQPEITADGVEEDPAKDDNSAAAVDIITIDETDTQRRKYAPSLASKKSVAQRMMDIALVTSNANQLRYISEFWNGTAYAYVCFVLLILSLILQFIVAVFLIFHSKPRSPRDKDFANNMVITGVLAVTVINILIASFGIEKQKD